MSRFEDLEVWKRSARLSANLYKAMADLKDFGFRDQITRAELSVPSNIAEGYEPKKFIRPLGAGKQDPSLHSG